MCNQYIIAFGEYALNKEDVQNKRVLEIGSHNINGSLRDYITSLNPHQYIGIDIVKANGVDLICNAEDIISEFGKESFDIIICTETLEHIFNWKLVVHNIKAICKPHGLILITVPVRRFHYHKDNENNIYNDYWRYEIEDMQKIFNDFTIITLKPHEEAGLLLLAKKSLNFKENDLEKYELYRMPESM